MPQDDTKAAWLLKAAAESGCVEAMDAWGVALCKGRGVKADPRAGVKWLLKAAKASYPPAMENLATCREQGIGLAQDANKATEWRIRSRAARGDRHAQAWLLKNAKEDF